MLEHAWNETGPRFKAWLAALLLLIGVGGFCYSIQLGTGLGVTGMSRDVSWGLYIGQVTFFVGVAASAVMVVLPYYLSKCSVELPSSVNFWRSPRSSCAFCSSWLTSGCRRGC